MYCFLNWRLRDSTDLVSCKYQVHGWHCLKVILFWEYNFKQCEHVCNLRISALLIECWMNVKCEGVVYVLEECIWMMFVVIGDVIVVVLNGYMCILMWCSVLSALFVLTGRGVTFVLSKWGRYCNVLLSILQVFVAAVLYSTDRDVVYWWRLLEKWWFYRWYRYELWIWHLICVV